MVLKISDLRKQYGLDPTFETEEEALAYEEERQAAYEERVAAKVQELKVWKRGANWTSIWVHEVVEFIYIEI